MQFAALVGVWLLAMAVGVWCNPTPATSVSPLKTMLYKMLGYQVSNENGGQSGKNFVGVVDGRGQQMLMAPGQQPCPFPYEPLPPDGKLPLVAHPLPNDQPQLHPKVVGPSGVLKGTPVLVGTKPIALPAPDVVNPIQVPGNPEPQAVDPVKIPGPEVISPERVPGEPLPNVVNPLQVSNETPNSPEVAAVSEVKPVNPIPGVDQPVVDPPQPSLPGENPKTVPPKVPLPDEELAGDLNNGKEAVMEAQSSAQEPSTQSMLGPEKPGWGAGENSPHVPPGGVFPLPLVDQGAYERPLPCSAVKTFLPPGFQYANIANYSNSRQPFIQVSRGEGPCSTLDALERLGLHRMRQLIIDAELQPIFDQTKGYTLFAPVDMGFERLPRWFLDALTTDRKLRQAFLLNHLVKEDVSLNSLDSDFLLLNARPGPNRIRANKYHDYFPSAIYTADGSRVLRGDFLSAQGRIHIVQKVIMPNPPRTAAEYLSERAEFESFWNVAKGVALAELQGSRPITLLIPVNSAVDKMTQAGLLATPQMARRFVEYHMLNGTWFGSGLLHGQFLLTNYLAKEIRVSVASDGFAKWLDGVNGHIGVVKSDIPLLNGCAHVIDDVLTEGKSFYAHDDSDEFQYEFGVISRRSMRVTSEEKSLVH